MIARDSNPATVPRMIQQSDALSLAPFPLHIYIHLHIYIYILWRTGLLSLKVWDCWMGTREKEGQKYRSWLNRPLLHADGMI